MCVCVCVCMCEHKETACGLVTHFLRVHVAGEKSPCGFTPFNSLYEGVHVCGAWLIRYPHTTCNLHPYLGQWCATW